MVARQEQGFYSKLIFVSSVDILPNFETESRKKERGQFYEVERLIPKRGERNEFGVSQNCKAKSWSNSILEDISLRLQIKKKIFQKSCYRWRSIWKKAGSNRNH